MHDEPLDQIAFYIGRAYYMYVGWLETLLDQSGLDRHVRPGMGQILCALYREDNLSIKEIASETQLAKSTLTGMLARMEKAGLVERRRDSQDGRVVRIRLTPMGQSLEAEFFRVAGAVNAAFLKGMGEREVANSRRLLNRLIEVMRNETECKRRSRQSVQSSGARS